MKQFAFTFLILFFFQHSKAQLLTNRLQLHQKASEDFLSTHFFENGRGMTLSPDLSIFLGDLKKKYSPLSIKDSIITKKFGFVPGKKQRYNGVFEVKYKNTELAVLGCTACHSGRAAGFLIPGLGNKTIDSYVIGKNLLKIQKLWGKIIQAKINKDPDYKYIHEKAMNFAQTIGNPKISNLTRGLVPDSVIKTFFYKDQGVAYGAEIQRTQVKVPFLWGFAKKRDVGVFADGSLNSANYAWAFGAELFASDSGDHLRASMPKLVDFVDKTIANLLPPEYPFEIDMDLALKGKAIARATCFRCHGEHLRDPQGFPIFEAPKLIPQNLVGTDEQRLDYGNSKWVDLAEQGSVSDLIFFNRDLFNYGYFAPQLWGVWSRFPYLHNGSVPNIYELLSSPAERPEVFSMKDAGELYRFDKTKLGLTTFKMSEINFNIRKAKNGNRDIYYTQREEHSNKGHYFQFMEQFSEDDKMSIIEYLKTL